jgi:hypothetical protein
MLIKGCLLSVVFGVAHRQLEGAELLKEARGIK